MGDEVKKVMDSLCSLSGFVKKVFIDRDKMIILEQYFSENYQLYPLDKPESNKIYGIEIISEDQETFIKNKVMAALQKIQETIEEKLNLGLFDEAKQGDTYLLIEKREFFRDVKKYIENVLNTSENCEVNNG